MSAIKQTGLPVNYGWYTSQQHNYKPRDVSLEIHEELARAILSNDDVFMKMAADAESGLTVSIQVGRDTLHMSVYTGDELFSRQRCTERDLSKSVLLMVGRDCKLRSVFRTDVERIATSYPSFYSVRSLTPAEVARLDYWQEIYAELGIEGARAKLIEGVALLVATCKDPSFDPLAVH